MTPEANRMPEVHARLGVTAELIDQRRAVYQASVEVLTGRVDDDASGPDVVDNPAVRGHLGEVLGGSTALEPSLLRPIGDLVAAGFADRIAGHPVRVAS